MLKTLLQKSICILALSFLASLNAQSYSLDATYVNFSFLSSNVTLQSGTQNTAGSVYKYSNLATVQGRLLYGKLSLVSTVNASLVTFDSDATAAARFQPVISTTASGYIQYKLEFFDSVTDFPVYLRNFYLNGIDLDGNNAATTEKYLLPLNEYSNYTTSTLSQLVISNIGSETQFRGISTSLPGITFENTASFYAFFNNPKTSITFKIGAAGAATDRQCAFALGSNGTFTGTTTTVPNNTPIPKTDLALTKTVNLANAAIGSTIEFTLTAKNNGPGNATNVKVGDKLPSGFTFVAADIPAGTTYSSTTGVWTIGNLANAGTAVLKITATVNATGNYTNAAGITGDEMESDTSNNGSSVTVTAFSQSDLQVSKSVDNASAPVGSNVTFTIISKNNGAANNTNVTVTDLLPSGFTYVSHTAPAGTTYIAATGLWTIGNLNNGASQTLKITAKLNASGNYTNSATINTTSGIADPNTVNNTATATVAIICTEQILGETFTAQNGVVKTFNQPATNYGFVFDIFKLDNSFNMKINGIDLATSELEFQSSGTPAPGINVRFADGSTYETKTPLIYNLNGTAAAPIIRVVISPTGSVSLFGSKVSGGPLFPLELFNGNALNTINWNAAAPNVVSITQRVVGVTNITGRGYGLNIIPCVCYDDANTTGTGLPSKHGITLLKKAGADNGNWPMTRIGAHTVLESNIKGFVITRIPTSGLSGITTPLDGMMVYDTTAECLKIYTVDLASPVNTGWKCFSTPGCP